MFQKAINLPLQLIGISAKTNDPTTWSSFQDVSAVIQKNKTSKRFTGIRLIFTEANNFAAIDIDGNLNDSQPHPVAKRFTTYPVFPQLWAWENSISLRIAKTIH